MTSARPPFSHIFIELAHSLSQRSTCSRLHVGCVITSPDHKHVLAMGYNGNAHGLANCCDSDTPGACGCLHAELNAAIKCPADVPKIVYCTHSPCVMCAKALLNLGGVEKLVYAEEYRSRDGIMLLYKAAIIIKHAVRA